MLLHANIPRRFWCYAISHATYLNNMTASSRMDRSKTIYEILFRRRPDITRIPPSGAFTCIYKQRRELKDQSFGLTSTQGAFIGIAYHRKTLGYCITDGTKVSQDITSFSTHTCILSSSTQQLPRPGRRSTTSQLRSHKQLSRISRSRK